MDYDDIIPYTCVYLDASWRDLLRGVKYCSVTNFDRASLLKQLQEIWMSDSNPNPVLPCLSVRTGLDLFLRVMNYPEGSEIIVSAINIPTMIEILHHHKLKVVPMDVNLETLCPKIELFDALVTDRTKAVLLAHIYGRWFDMQPFIARAREHKLSVIEDCAEGFCGFQRLGHPSSDISLISFGTLKYYTAFGGAFAKVRDPEIFRQMSDIYSKAPMQSQTEYLKKLLKYSGVYVLLNCPRFIKPGMWVLSRTSIDHKAHVVSMMRGFPDKMVEKIQQQPCDALLGLMLHRLTHVDPADHKTMKIKGDYVSERLPASTVQIGTKADVTNYWLFPVLVDNPDEVLKRLNALGVDAYRGATQLNIVEPDNGNSHLKHLHSFATRYPHEAKYIMDHIIYLPVNKTVPFHELDRICAALHVAVDLSGTKQLLPLRLQKIKMQSKL